MIEIKPVVPFVIDRDGMVYWQDLMTHDDIIEKFDITEYAKVYVYVDPFVDEEKWYFRRIAGRPKWYSERMARESLKSIMKDWKNIHIKKDGNQFCEEGQLRIAIGYSEQFVYGGLAYAYNNSKQVIYFGEGRSSDAVIQIVRGGRAKAYGGHQYVYDGYATAYDHTVQYVFGGSAWAHDFVLVKVHGGKANITDRAIADHYGGICIVHSGTAKYNKYRK